MKKIWGVSFLTICLAIAGIAGRLTVHAASQSQLLPLHPSRAIDTAGFYFAHDLRQEATGAMTLVTTVATGFNMTADGVRVPAGEIRIMEYVLTTDDAGHALADATFYDRIVAGLYNDSVVELQFRAQLAMFRQRAIDVSTMQAKAAPRILAAKNAPPPIINSTVVPPPSTGACAAVQSPPPKP